MSVTVRIRRSAPALRRAAAALGLKTNVIAYDTETTGLVPYGDPWYWGYWPARPFAHAFCDSDGNTAYVRDKVDPTTREVIPDPHTAPLVADALADPFIIKIGHNLGFDERMSMAMGRPLEGERHDTQILGHVATAGDEISYALKPLAKKYSGYPDTDEKELEKAVASARREAKKKGWLIAGGKKEVDRGDRVVFAGNKPVKADYWLAPDKLCKRYAVGDVERTMLLFLQWFPGVRADREHGWRTYCREMDLFYVLRRMERRGTRVYPDRTAFLIAHYEEYKKKQRALAWEHGGFNPFKPEEPLNFNSSKQMIQKFYVEKGYPKVYSEKPPFNPTLNKNVLAMWGMKSELTEEYKDPLAKAIVEWKGADQANKSFLKIYQRMWYPETRERKIYVLHPNYNQSGTVTGRMSCSDPNLQQVAAADTGLRRSDIEQRPRECFGPRPGCLWYLPDFSQMEVWVFAYLSGEKNMQELLLSGHDFHQGVAAKSFMKRPDYEARKKYYRKLAKLIMFGKLYGGGVGSEEKPGRMTKLMEMPFKETKEFIDSFDDQFEAVKQYMEDVIDDTRHVGEAFNLYGRRYVMERHIAYKVVNYLVQGGCADLMKMATMRVDWLLETRWRHPMLGLLNQIHDEMMIEVPYELHSKKLMREIIWVMQMDSHLIAPVPLPVEIKLAPKRWSHTVKVAMTDNEDRSHPEFEGWVRGGVPRDGFDHEFADVERHMRDCPYKTDRPDPKKFELTRTYLGSLLSADAA